METFIIFLIISGLTAPKPCISVDDSQILGSANAKFTLSLLKGIYTFEPETSQSNMALSSLGLSQVLSMLLLGSRGNSFNQVIEALEFEEFLSHHPTITSTKQEYLHSAIFNLTKVLETSPGQNLTLRNSILNSVLLVLDPDYLKQVQTYYNATWKNLIPNHKLSFASIINKGQIRQVMKGAKQEPKIILIISNDAYLKTSWKDAFDIKETANLPFKCDDGTVEMVKMMQGTRKALYGSQVIPGIKVEVMELDFADDNLALLYLVPSRNALKGLISNLPRYELDSIRSKLSFEVLKVVVPIIDTTMPITLKSVLSHFGIADLFGEKANLCITHDPSFNKLSVGEIFHRTFLSLNEGGINAAAGTGTASYRILGNTAITFKADRPFVYFVIDKRYGTVLYTGTYVHNS